MNRTAKRILNVSFVAAYFMGCGWARATHRAEHPPVDCAVAYPDQYQQWAAMRDTYPSQAEINRMRIRCRQYLDCDQGELTKGTARFAAGAFWPFYILLRAGAEL